MYASRLCSFIWPSICKLYYNDDNNDPSNPRYGFYFVPRLIIRLELIRTRLLISSRVYLRPFSLPFWKNHSCLEAVQILLNEFIELEKFISKIQLL